jgi:hypothetical protein
MRVRFRRTALAVLAMASLVASAHVANAQSAGTGTVTGHIIWCRALAGPVVSAGDGDDSPDLADVTPGLRKGITPPPPIRVAAQDIVLTVQGTPISARTDAAGSFTLTGVPAAQPLTLVAQVASGPSLVVSGPDVTLNAGQTLDLGTIGVPDCTGNSDAFTLQPATDPSAQPADPTAPADAP